MVLTSPLTVTLEFTPQVTGTSLYARSAVQPVERAVGSSLRQVGSLSSAGCDVLGLTSCGFVGGAALTVLQGRTGGGGCKGDASASPSQIPAQVFLRVTPAVLQTCRQLELEIRPLFLVPDTNGFIDHLASLKKLMSCGLYILVVPLIVITELDGLAKGQDSRGGSGGGGGSTSSTHARGVQERAKAAVSFLERGFEAREPCLRALTSRGNQLESIAFRNKAKDFMPTQRDEPVRLHREVVLLTDDRNLRVKALTRNVPVRDIPAFLSWAKVG
ncbi:hypothetical protein JZ751_022876 [Albula glossodonta]|uniref:PIN domain-containing protein n=1 Tax=Albula glossodonta TaxID=121402 RepID=A0A8T2PGF0_9TELE|nr:hypothetical protein JZ751_022876 [Albula glossodonta]